MGPCQTVLGGAAPGAGRPSSSAPAPCLPRSCCSSAGTPWARARRRRRRSSRPCSAPRSSRIPPCWPTSWRCAALGPRGVGSETSVGASGGRSWLRSSSAPLPLQGKSILNGRKAPEPPGSPEGEGAEHPLGAATGCPPARRDSNLVTSLVGLCKSQVGGEGWQGGADRDSRAADTTSLLFLLLAEEQGRAEGSGKLAPARGARPGGGRSLPGAEQRPVPAAGRAPLRPARRRATLRGPRRRPCRGEGQLEVTARAGRGWPPLAHGGFCPPFLQPPRPAGRRGTPAVTGTSRGRRAWSLCSAGWITWTSSWPVPTRYGAPKRTRRARGARARAQALPLSRSSWRAPSPRPWRKNSSRASCSRSCCRCEYPSLQRGAKSAREGALYREKNPLGPR